MSGSISAGVSLGGISGGVTVGLGGVSVGVSTGIPFPPLPLPLYPAIIPGLLGVPPIATPLLLAPLLISPTLSDGPGIPAQFSPLLWGFYLGGAPLFPGPGSSVVEFEYNQEYNISDFPQEAGTGGTTSSFASYNKVQLPFEGRVRYAFSGSAQSVGSLILTAQMQIQQLTLCQLYTREGTYSNVNLTRMNTRRTAQQGETLVLMDIYYKQVRVVTAATFTQTQTPAAAGNQNGGTTQPASPTAGQSIIPTASSDSATTLSAPAPASSSNASKFLM